jgi:ABC-type multidrug transport system ATPase subunit
MASLELRNIEKRYGRKRVLDDVSLILGPGLTLLVGPSGAGKSTLLRLIATAEKPNRGAVVWTGKPGGRSGLRRTLGYAPQAVDLPEDLTAREFALHIAALKGLNLAAADRQFGAITDAIGLHADINNRIASFSGGMRRRLKTARKLGALIVERAKTAIVVMTTHLADELAPHAVATLRVEAGRVLPASTPARQAEAAA